MASSSLTRQVFRRLVAGQPLRHHGCLRQQLSDSACHVRHGSRTRGHGSKLSFSQRRHFFNFNLMGNRRNENRGADLAPGIEQMTDFVKRQRVHARLPSRGDLGTSLLDFLKSRNKSQKCIEDTQAWLVLQSLKYCMETSESEANPLTEKTLNETIVSAANALSFHHSTGLSQKHVELADYIYSALANAPVVTRVDYLDIYCQLLARQGQWRKAHGVIQAFEKQVDAAAITNTHHDVQSGQKSSDIQQKSTKGESLCSTVWLNLLKSVIENGPQSSFTTVHDLLRRRNLHRSPQVIALTLEHHLQGEDPESVKRSWREYLQLVNEKRGRTNSSLEEFSAQHISPGTAPIVWDLDNSWGAMVSSLLRWCADKKEFTFGNEVVAELVRTSPSKPVWDAIFVWAAANGKGADEINRMIGVMEKSNDGVQDRAHWCMADITTINELVSFAIRKDDSYLAERFISLGRERNIKPDRKTYALQLVYRLDVKDIDGALIAYKNLQDLHTDSAEDAPIVNKLIRALCDSPAHDFDTVMNVAADLSERQARFEASTVSKLATLHMSRDEMHDVVDLLNTHASEFSSQERTGIADALIEFCLSPKSMTAQSWEVYSILRESFDEIDRDKRTKIMLHFFKAGRPDMAVNVFNHMRAHSRADTIPITDTYIAAFKGIAELQDLDSLEVVHNQLKLDYNVNPDTRLRNALAFGYIACENPRKALQIFDQIVASKEGPNYSSIHLAFRACEQTPFGDVKAQEIWDNLERKNIELNASLWASYAAAVAGNGKVDEAIAIVRRGMEQASLVVDPFLVGSLCLVTPNEVKRDEVEAWAKEDHPEVWDQLAKSITTDEDGLRTYPIDRNIAL